MLKATDQTTPAMKLSAPQAKAALLSRGGWRVNATRGSHRNNSCPVHFNAVMREEVSKHRAITLNTHIHSLTLSLTHKAHPE